MIYPGVIRNWRDQEPANSHGAVGWKILTERDLNGLPYEIAPLKGIHGITFRMLQPGKKEPDHVNDTKEHVTTSQKVEGKCYLAMMFLMCKRVTRYLCRLREFTQLETAFPK